MSSAAAVAPPGGVAAPSCGLYHTLMTHRCHGVCAHDSCFLSVIRGFRHGMWYGMKIRFPHALVMTFLFRSGSFTDKMSDVCKATYQHSRNLALYVSLYKLVTCLMRHLRGVESPLNSLVGGAIGGAIMFGSNTPVNSQINMYVMSRVIMGGAKALSANGYLPSEAQVPHAYTMYAATVWALVMYMEQWQNRHLQKSLATSMRYLYHESNKWPQIKDASFVDWFLG
jgi:peroxisomal membrane protein 4